MQQASAPRAADVLSGGTNAGPRPPVHGLCKAGAVDQRRHKPHYLKLFSAPNRDCILTSLVRDHSTCGDHSTNTLDPLHI